MFLDWLWRVVFSILCFGDITLIQGSIADCDASEVGLRKCVLYYNLHDGQQRPRTEWATCMRKEDFNYSVDNSYCRYNYCWNRCTGVRSFSIFDDSCRCEKPKTCPYKVQGESNFRYAEFGTLICMKQIHDFFTSEEKWEWTMCVDPNVDVPYHPLCFQSWENNCFTMCIQKSQKTKGFPENCTCKPGDEIIPTTGSMTATTPTVTRTATTKTPPSTTLATTTTLPPWCYNPTGDSCHWYIECLEKRFPCHGSSADYAIKYAMHFCYAYDRNFHWFSLKGRQWVDATRKCLQQQLVHFFNRDDSKQITTCQEIQETAFESHNCCYTAGTKCTVEDRPSICEIPCRDWFRVFWTIKEAFVGDTVYESLSGFWHVAKSCTFNPHSQVTHDCVNKFGAGAFPWLRVGRFIVNLKSLINRKRRSLVNGGMTDHDYICINIINSISSQLGWDKNELDWFVYTNDRNLTSAKRELQISINYMVIDKQAKNATNATYSNLLNKTVSKMMSSLAKGKINLDSELYGNEVQLKIVEECETLNCKNVSVRIEVPTQQRCCKGRMVYSNLTVIFTFVLVTKFVMYIAI